MVRLYAAARPYMSFFQPSFKLRVNRREGARLIQRYHDLSASGMQKLSRSADRRRWSCEDDALAATRGHGAPADSEVP